jgi:cardiolipin synthase
MPTTETNADHALVFFRPDSLMHIKRPVLIITCILTAGGRLAGAELRMPPKRKSRPSSRAMYETDDPQFRRSLGVLLGPPIVEGNKVEVLLNGDQIFPAMLKAIRGKEDDHLRDLYLLVGNDRQGIRRRAGRARARRRQGAPDARLDRQHEDGRRLETPCATPASAAALPQAGLVEAGAPEQPHPPQAADRRRPRRLHGRRRHRRQVARQRPGRNHWRDTHFRVEGPVVGQMQAVFNDNWTKATGVVLDGEDYFPALGRRRHAGPDVLQLATGGSESMHLMYLMAITAARRSIDLSNSYFVPDELAVKALVAAAKRGVKVRIITPGKIIDSDVVRAASRERWGDC